MSIGTGAAGYLNALVIGGGRSAVVTVISIGSLCFGAEEHRKHRFRSYNKDGKIVRKRGGLRRDVSEQKLGKKCSRGRHGTN